MNALPVHQPDVYNIDALINYGRWTWKCVGNRANKEDAISSAKTWAEESGIEHQVIAPTGEKIFSIAP